MHHGEGRTASRWARRAGCNLACRFCQKWDISKSRETDTLADAASPEAIAAAAARLGCRSVAFTYNDPVIFMEYAMDVADACRERGVKAVAVTAGYMTAGPRAEFYRHMDAANVDLKALRRAFRAPRVLGRHPALVDEALMFPARPSTTSRFVEEFPMTSTGKIQKVKLRERAWHVWPQAPPR